MKFVGLYSLWDEVSWGLDSPDFYRSSLYKLETNYITRGSIDGFDTDHYQITIPYSGEYRITISNNPINNWGSFWYTGTINATIVDNLGFEVQGFRTTAYYQSDGVIEFSWNGGYNTDHYLKLSGFSNATYAVQMTQIYSTPVTPPPPPPPPANNPPIGEPILEGQAEPGGTLSVDTKSISDADGLGDFSYQWMRNGMPIQGANSSDYQVRWADLYSEITIHISYIDGVGNSELLQSQPIGPIQNPLSPEDIPVIAEGLSNITEIAIQQVFVGLLGRPVKESGLIYWKDAIESDNGFGITEFMWNTVNEQKEYIDAFSGATRKEAVSLHFNFLFSRDPYFQVRDDNPEWNYWVDGEGAIIPVNELVIALLLGAQGDDLLALSNKMYVADYITTNQPDLASPLGVEVLGMVNKDVSSIGLALQSVDLFV